MARRKKKSKSFFKFYLPLFIIFVGSLFGLAQKDYPQYIDALEEKIAQILYPQSSQNNAPILSTGTELAVNNYTPSCAKNLQVLKNIGYVVGFSNELKVPIWVGYVATYPFKFDTSKRPSSFFQDYRAHGSAEHKDYSNTGFDRGHMAPNYVIGRCYGNDAQMETFYMTNIIPQKPNMNRNQWKDIEQYIANDLSKKHGKVLVFVGPIFEGKISKLKGKVAIPKASYAVILAQNAKREMCAIGFIVPQEPTKKSIWDYCVAIDEIEKLVGIDFLPQLPDNIENKLEANTSITPFLTN